MTKSPANNIALVTGANRGIGFEIVRQLAAAGVRPILSARDPAKGEAAAALLKSDGIEVATIALDVTSEASVEGAIAEIETRYGPIAILVNNAAVLLDGPGGFDSSLFEMTDETLTRTFETNVAAPTKLIQKIVPSMKARGYGRVVNLSSMAGQLAGMTAGFPAYRISKAALNALTRIAAAEAAGGNIKINAMCPGWCRTEMGGPSADRSPAQGAETAVWLATLPDDGPTGGFFQDKAAIAW